MVNEVSGLVKKPVAKQPVKTLLNAGNATVAEQLNGLNTAANPMKLARFGETGTDWRKSAQQPVHLIKRANSDDSGDGENDTTVNGDDTQVVVSKNKDGDTVITIHNGGKAGKTDEAEDPNTDYRKEISEKSLEDLGSGLNEETDVKKKAVILSVMLDKLKSDEVGEKERTAADQAIITYFGILSSDEAEEFEKIYKKQNPGQTLADDMEAIGFRGPLEEALNRGDAYASKPAKEVEEFDEAEGPEEEKTAGKKRVKLEIIVKLLEAAAAEQRKSGNVNPRVNAALNELKRSDSVEV